MPGFDGTGPRGQGSMTGGGRGYCNPNFVEMRTPSKGYPSTIPYRPGVFYRGYSYGGFGWGKGIGRGFGMRRGMGIGFRQQITPNEFPLPQEEQIERLRRRARILRDELNQIDYEISEFERG